MYSYFYGKICIIVQLPFFAPVIWTRNAVKQTYSYALKVHVCHKRPMCALAGFDQARPISEECVFMKVMEFPPSLPLLCLTFESLLNPRGIHLHTDTHIPFHLPKATRSILDIPVTLSIQRLPSAANLLFQ